jgi:hypothetical protein
MASPWFPGAIVRNRADKRAKLGNRLALLRKTFGGESGSFPNRNTRSLPACSHESVLPARAIVESLRVTHPTKLDGETIANCLIARSDGWRHQCHDRLERKLRLL